MEEARDRRRSEGELEQDEARRVGAAVGTAAASAVLATSLVAALGEPPDVEMISLPEPVPIVQQHVVDDDDPDDDEDRRETSQASRWQRILRMLTYLLVALLLVAAILLGALKGCVGLAGPLFLSPSDSEQEQPSQPTSSTDERGLAW